MTPTVIHYRFAIFFAGTYSSKLGASLTRY